MTRAVAFLGLIALAACASSDRFDYAQTLFVIAPVERRLTDEEVFQAVERIVAAAPVCIPIPSAYWEGRAPFTVRFGPSQWRGRPIAADVEERLDDFVRMGFWTRSDIAPDGDRLSQFQLTELGERSYRGHPFQPRGEAAFCPSAERRLIRIVEAKRIPASRPDRHPALGFYPPESLGVRFEWLGATQPSWLRTPALRERYGSLAPNSVTPSTGYVNLFRIWRRDRHPLADAPHSGALEQFCYDYIHNRGEECWPRFD